MVTVTHYAKTVNGQPNTNMSDYKYRNEWDNCQNASASNPTIAPKGNGHSTFEYKNTLGVSNKTFDKKAKLKERPFTLTGHDFQFDIPLNACISKITFKVRMKVDNKINVPAPLCRFNMYYGTKPVETYRVDDVGWENGTYFNKSSSASKLSNTWTTYEYVMTGSNYRKRGYPISQLNDSRMGIDLRFYEPTSQSAVNDVYVKWISCTVEYTLPNHSITFPGSKIKITDISSVVDVSKVQSYLIDDINSIGNPKVVMAGDEYTVKVIHKNNSCSGDGTREIQVKLPPNTVVTDSVGNYDINTNIWTVDCSPYTANVLQLTLKSYGLDYQNIIFSEPVIGDYPFYVYVIPSENDEGEVKPYPSEIHKGHTSCVEFRAKVNATDGEANFIVNLDTANNSASNVKWSIIEQETSPDVSLIEDSRLDDTHVNFSVPDDGTVVDIAFRGCFVPSFVGDSGVIVRLDDNEPATAPYTSLPNYTYIFTNTAKKDNDVCSMVLNQDEIDVYTHRVVTSTEIGATVIDCGVADYEIMEISDCNLVGSVWERINYIASVPLKFSHFDPHSTFENKLINQSYKNKVYMGKEGVIDEDITLNIRIPPRDVTTLQGYVEIDKPVPINANWKCFEGDALNHRGWVELTKITAEKTNPLYYKCELDVKYITHDIHTKFDIFRGDRINTVDMPDILTDIVTEGSNLSTSLDTFEIDTDGGYFYDEEGEEGLNNLFSLDEGQHLSIKTKNALASTSQLNFEWYSNEIEEVRENNLNRIFRLKDKTTGRVVFEYEYTNFVFSDAFVTCDVIARVMNKVEGYDVTKENIDLRTEIDAELISEEDEIIYDGSEEEPDDEEEADAIADGDVYEEGYIAPPFDPSQYDVSVKYGSTIILSINQNRLRFTDMGLNGREFYDEFTLLDGNYIFETVWVNENHDGMTEDIISYIDINLSETILNTIYSETYGKLVVSPFPVPKKKVVFTRESEEGTIYYMFDDNYPFKYRLEPFYQYHCGCDLITRDGISLFNLNNGYTPFYIENGLVRLGFNKYNGELYLAKWDILSKEWVTTHYFKMRDDITFSVGYLSDDKIIIKAGDDTFFTIWRGHPYILVNNPTDTIYFDNKFSYAYADKVDGVEYEYPIIHSFMNTDNLLPLCIGGKAIDYDCISIDDESEVSNISIAVDTTGDFYATQPSTLSAITEATEGKVHYIVDGDDIGNAEYPYDLEYTFPKEGAFTVQAIYVGDNDDVGISEKVIIKVAQTTHIPTPPEQSSVEGNYKLVIYSAPKQFVYRDGEKVVLQLTKGDTPIRKMDIETQRPNGTTFTLKTDANGMVEIVNNNIDYVPGTYEWGGRFYNWQDDDGDGTLVYKALRKIKLVKATPSITHNASQNKINKGKKLTVTLTGQVGALADKKLTYTLNGGSKTTKTTNDNGKIYIPFNTKGTFKVKVMYAGSVRYKATSETFTIKVV